MTMPTSGQISLGDARTELSADYAPTGQITLNDTAVRTLFAKSGDSTNIQLSDGYSKTFRRTLSAVFTTNHTNYNINISSLSGYIAGKTDATVTINSGVYIYSTSTSSAALTISGGTAGDILRLINNGGYILGAGGRGGDGGGANPARPGGAGSAGGTAISVLSTTTFITNNGTIAGGGGGGGGGGGFNTGDWYGGAGGGGGAVFGGAGTRAAWSGAGTGGAGEASAGTLLNGGAGGRTINVSAAGGKGGEWGQAGTNGNGGARGNAPGGTGGAAGNYISGSPNVTWLVAGTRLGGAS